MKLIVYIALAVFVCCNKKQRNSEAVTTMSLLPELYFEKNDSALKNINGTWFYNSHKVYGYILEKRGNSLIAKLPVIEGKENGVAYGWFETGEKKYQRSFNNGQRHGVHKTWFKNGQLASVNFYVNDKLEGEQKGYFENGKIWQVLNYKKGYEEGKQKTWNNTGRVINNFTVKNGKLYGVIGRYDCMSVMQK